MENITFPTPEVLTNQWTKAELVNFIQDESTRHYGTDTFFCSVRVGEKIFVAKVLNGTERTSITIPAYTEPSQLDRGHELADQITNQIALKNSEGILGLVEPGALFLTSDKKRIIPEGVATGDYSGVRFQVDTSRRLHLHIIADAAKITPLMPDTRVARLMNSVSQLNNTLAPLNIHVMPYVPKLKESKK